MNETNGSGAKLVYESEDNPVVRTRTLEKENNKTRAGLLVIFLLLFVPPQDRSKVIEQLPAAVFPPAAHVPSLFRRQS